MGNIRTILLWSSSKFISDALERIARSDWCAVSPFSSLLRLFLPSLTPSQFPCTHNQATNLLLASAADSPKRKLYSVLATSFVTIGGYWSTFSLVRGGTIAYSSSAAALYRRRRHLIDTTVHERETTVDEKKIAHRFKLIPFSWKE